jgi:hypothetical protein
MKIKGLQDEQFGDYKKPVMYIAMPSCTFKCDKENGCAMCQNSALAHQPTYDVASSAIIERYLDNPITKGIVFGGLEPFDSSEELSNFINLLREWYSNNDDIVIYTGYTEEELQDNPDYLDILQYPNIIVKFGRFRPGHTPHYDEVLGIKLASDNQYAKKVSKYGNI